MIRRGLDLTEARRQTLGDMGDRTGRPHQDPVAEAVERRLREIDDQSRLANIMQAAGMGKDRHDALNLDGIRGPWAAVSDGSVGCRGLQRPDRLRPWAVGGGGFRASQ